MNLSTSNDIAWCCFGLIIIIIGIIMIPVWPAYGFFMVRVGEVIEMMFLGSWFRWYISRIINKYDSWFHSVQS